MIVRELVVNVERRGGKLSSSFESEKSEIGIETANSRFGRVREQELGKARLSKPPQVANCELRSTYVRDRTTRCLSIERAIYLLDYT